MVSYTISSPLFLNGNGPCFYHPSVPCCSSGNKPELVCEFSALGLCDLHGAPPSLAPGWGTRPRPKSASYGGIPVLSRIGLCENVL